MKSADIQEQQMMANSFFCRPFVISLFCLLAFLPSVFHLMSPDIPVTNSIVALGPITAGFFFALNIRQIRINSMLLGFLVSVFLWSVNWMMFAGQDCCSGPH